MSLDRTDLEMARVALSYYKRAHVLSRRPVPPAAERLAGRLEQELAGMTSKRQEDGVPQLKSLSTREIAQRMKCSPSTALRIAQRYGHKTGRDWLVSSDALPELLEGEDD